jgi:GNAT superfamily N-acetyltransferase
MVNPGNIEVSFIPSIEELELIRTWLVKEDEESGQGFYINWSSIQSSFDDGYLAVAILNNQPIGFIAFRENGFTTVFNIVEIHPRWRRKGVGNLLVSLCFKYLVSRDSESFWRKMGFSEFSNGLRDGYSNKWLYKVLIPSLPNSVEDGQVVRIELWNKEPHQIKDEVPNWIWYPKLKRPTGQLSAPIVQSAYHNWRIRVSVRNEPKFDDCIKYLDRRIPIECRDFIMIKDLSTLID